MGCTSTPRFRTGITLKGSEEGKMRKTMRWFSRALLVATTGLLLMSAPNAASAQQRRVVVIESVPVFDPFFPYPYPYPPGYVVRNYGYVKLKMHGRDAWCTWMVDTRLG